MNTKRIADPGLAEMIATLQLADVGHPGEGWFSAPEIAESSGMHFTTIKRKLNASVKAGTHESCQRKVGSNIVTFYRLKGKVPGKCSTRANHDNPVRSFPPALYPAKQRPSCKKTRGVK
jgi:hypothetical protein